MYFSPFIARVLILNLFYFVWLRTCIHHVVSVTALSHTQIDPPFSDVVFARSLPEMSAARRNVVEIACGCAAHILMSCVKNGSAVS